MVEKEATRGRKARFIQPSGKCKCLHVCLSQHYYSLDPCKPTTTHVIRGEREEGKTCSNYNRRGHKREYSSFFFFQNHRGHEKLQCISTGWRLSDSNRLSQGKGKSRGRTSSSPYLVSEEGQQIDHCNLFFLGDPWIMSKGNARQVLIRLSFSYPRRMEGRKIIPS